jgi:hypothetical protein
MTQLASIPPPTLVGEGLNDFVGRGVQGLGGLQCGDARLTVDTQIELDSERRNGPVG